MYHDQGGLHSLGYDVWLQGKAEFPSVFIEPKQVSSTAPKDQSLTCKCTLNASDSASLLALALYQGIETQTLAEQAGNVIG